MVREGRVLDRFIRPILAQSGPSWLKMDPAAATIEGGRGATDGVIRMGRGPVASVLHEAMLARTTHALHRTMDRGYPAAPILPAKASTVRARACLSARLVITVGATSTATPVAAMALACGRSASSRTKPSISPA